MSKVNHAEVNRILREERGIYCEYCHERLWTHKHHALYGRSKSKPAFNALVNYMCVCHICHLGGYVDTYQVRVIFYRIQLLRGYDVDGWIASLDLKVTSDFARYIPPLAISTERSIRDLVEEWSTKE